jgi:hypothetical protein
VARAKNNIEVALSQSTLDFEESRLEEDTVRYQPVHHTIVAVDVVASGGLDDRQLLRTRADLRAILQAALMAQSIDLGQLDFTDLGDGLRFLAPSAVPPNLLLDPFILDLDSHLAARRSDTDRIRLRVAVHQGLVHRDGDEWVGAPLVLVARLIDAAPVRRAIRSVPEANLVLVISQSIYDSVVCHGYGLDRGRYQTITVVEKETSTSAWIFMPGPLRQLGAGHLIVQPPFVIETDGYRLGGRAVGSG